MFCSEKEKISKLRSYIDSTCSISEESWELITSISNFESKKKGEILLDFMQVENSIRFLTKGIVKCEYVFNGLTFVCDFRVAPIILTEIYSFIKKTSSNISIEAITDCEYIELPRREMNKIIFSNPDLARFTSLLNANYLGLMQYRHALHRTFDAKKRYKEFLKEFPSVARHAKQSDIASYIGITQQSLSRLRSNLIDDNREKYQKSYNEEIEVNKLSQSRTV